MYINKFTSTTPVVIMAGGQGTRMEPFTRFLPKPLLIYKEKTLIENIIDLFSKSGFSIFYILLYYKKELIKAYLDSLSLPYEIHYVEEPFPMGTVGGVQLLEKELTADFLLCNCDNLGHFPYEELLREHKMSKADLTILAKPCTYTIPFGLILSDETNVVHGIREKPTSDYLISTGIHIVSPRFVSFIGDNSYLDMPDAINMAAEKLFLRVANVGDADWMDMSLGFNNTQNCIF